MRLRPRRGVIARWCPIPSSCASSALTSTADLSPGTRYSLLWEIMSRFPWKYPARVIVPSTTTPIRSRKSCGGTPLALTWTVPPCRSITSNSRLEAPSLRTIDPGATRPPRRIVAPMALSPAPWSSVGPQ